MARTFRKWAVGLTATVAGASVLMAAGPQIDSKLPTYRPVSGVSGNIKSIGSDTMNNLMTLWGEEFKAFYPAARVEIEGKGSSTAPAALIEGQSQFGPMSRPMKSSEIDKFEKNFGYKPTALRTAIDALAVFVHKDCPLDEISIQEVTDVFSVAGRDMTWGDLGVKDRAWASRPISLYGRNSASGTYGFFKDVALQRQRLQGSASRSSPARRPWSRAWPATCSAWATRAWATPPPMSSCSMFRLMVAMRSPPNSEFANSGEYPLARFLYVYVNVDPVNGVDDPLRAEFIKMVFSKQGQEVVLKDGYYPVSAGVAREDLKACKLDPKF